MANAAAASIGSSRSPTSSKRSSPSRNSRGRAKRGRESKITATGTDTRAAATSTLALAAQRLGTPLRVVLCKHPLSTLNIFETTPLIVAPTCTIGVLRHFLAAHVLRQRGRQRCADCFALEDVELPYCGALFGLVDVKSNILLFGTLCCVGAEKGQTWKSFSPNLTKRGCWIPQRS